MNTLENKICLVTGGTRGIGRAITEMLLTEGARVVVCGQRPDGIHRAIEEMSVRWPGKVRGKAADVRDHEAVAALFAFADQEFGGLDVLVNNAGSAKFGKISQLSIGDWHQMLDGNLSGAFYCCREALPRFAARGGGFIVNISSLAGKNAFAGGTAYNASKFGLNGMSEAMMLDVRYDNVRVSTVMPGSVATAFSGGNADAGLDWKIHPEDVAGIVKMLLNMPERTTVSQVEVRPSRPKRN